MGDKPINSKSKMNNCNAIGCTVPTKYFMCFPHHRLLPVRLRVRLKIEQYRGSWCLKAIEYLAERENKEITSNQYMTLVEKYNERSNTSKELT